LHYQRELLTTPPVSEGDGDCSFGVGLADDELIETVRERERKKGG
jgi:hypothetical protein